jgi:hypothetical protein
MEVCGAEQSADAEIHTLAVVEGLKRHGVAAWPKVVIAPSLNPASQDALNWGGRRWRSAMPRS